MQEFKKRTYQSLGQFREDLQYLWRHRRHLQFPLGVKGIDGRFRERLMLAVISVNRCRYCSFAHSRAALKEGISRDRVDELLQGEFKDVPDSERPAVIYAQHWADTRGRPDPESVKTMLAAYGDEAAQQIDFTLHLIKLCNYLGNAWDYLLFRVTFGLCGGG